jgi:hypothetical protein
LEQLLPPSNAIQLPTPARSKQPAALDLSGGSVHISTLSRPSRSHAVTDFPEFSRLFNLGPKLINSVIPNDQRCHLEGSRAESRGRVKDSCNPELTTRPKGILPKPPAQKSGSRNPFAHHWRRLQFILPVPLYYYLNKILAIIPLSS